MHVNKYVDCAIDLCNLHLGDSQGLCGDETCKHFPIAFVDKARVVC